MHAIWRLRTAHTPHCAHRSCASHEYCAQQGVVPQSAQAGSCHLTMPATDPLHGSGTHRPTPRCRRLGHAARAAMKILARPGTDSNRQSCC